MKREKAARLIAVLGLSWLAFMVVCSSGQGYGGERVSPLVEAARKDLSERLGITVGEIELVGEVEVVTWRDTSLGCPEPGKMYAQVLTPGYKFTLKTGDNFYVYHTGRGVVRLCREFPISQ